jgi:hypothetical protein
MNQRDANIVKKYPDKTAYELMSMHGLSKAGYEEMSKASPKSTVTPTETGAIRPTSIVEVSEADIRRISNSPSRLEQPHSITDLATLYNKVKNISKRMNRTQAEKLARKYPNEFEII